MKTIFRVLMLGLVTAAIGAVAATSAFAQDACADTYEVKQASYQKFRDGRLDTVKSPRTLEKAKIGIPAGEEFIRKYEACADDKQVVDFIKEKLPELKEWVALQELYVRFNTATKDKKTYNSDEAFSSGKGIIAKNPDLAFDVGIALALVGFENSLKNPPIDKYNSEAINFAKQAISDVGAAKTSSSYGAKAFNCGVKIGTGATAPVDPAKSKNCVLGWMNYVIGSIMYYNRKEEKDALPYFYKATQIDSDVKNKADIYSAIGGWYLKEIVKMETDRQAKIKDNKDQDNPETLAILAMMKGYADRGINALSKAYKIANADAKTPADFKKSLYDKLQGLYQVRFDKTEGLDVHIATAATQPLIDPMIPVAPVIEVAPTTTSTTTTSTPTTGTTTKPTTPATTKPAATTTTKPATTTTTPTTPAKPTSTTTTTKPAAKATGGKTNTTKPKSTVNKKKGVK